jgi:hypothetical protein
MYDLHPRANNLLNEGNFQGKYLVISKQRCKVRAKLMPEDTNAVYGRGMHPTMISLRQCAQHCSLRQPSS